MKQNLTKKELAGLAGLTVRRIGQLQTEGVLPATEPLDAGECIRALLAFYKRRSTPTDISAARLRKLTAEARLAEIELGRQTDSLWPSKAFPQLFTAFWAVQRSYIFRLPGELAQRIRPDMTPAAIDRLTYDTMAEVLQDLRESGHLELIKTEHGAAAKLFIDEYYKQYGQPQTF